MFKRYFCILLTLALCVGCFAFSANASELNNFDNSGWIDLYDYNPSIFQTHTISDPDLPLILDFEIQGAPRLYWIDMILYSSNISSMEILVGNTSASAHLLTMDTLGDGMYRFRGYIRDPLYDKLRMYVWTTQYVNFDIVSLRVSVMPKNYYAVMYSGSGSSVDGSFYFEDVPGNNAGVFNIDAVGDFSFNVSPNDYKPYDFIDLTFWYDSVEISSISATWGGSVFLPVDYNFISSSNDSYSLLTTVRVDLRGIRRDTGKVTINISGKSTSSSSSWISFRNCIGSVFVEAPDPYISWFDKIVWSFTILWNNISSRWDSYSDHLDAWFTHIYNAIENADFNFSLGPTFDNGISSIISSIGDSVSDIINASGLDVSKITSAIGDAVSNINNSFGIDVSEITSTLTNGFNRLVDSTTVDWNNIVNQIGGFFNNLVDSFEAIFSIDKDVGDDFKDSLDSVIDLEHQITDLPTHQNNGTGAFLVSDPNDSVGDVSEQLFQNGIVRFYDYAVPISSITVMFSYLTNHSAILTLMSVSLTLGLLAVILNIGIAIYRKKGD